MSLTSPDIYDLEAMAEVDGIATNAPSLLAEVARNKHLRERAWDDVRALVRVAVEQCATDALEVDHVCCED